MKPEWIMWLAILLLVGFLASMPSAPGVPDNVVKQVKTYTATVAETQAERFARDPMANTTRARDYIENYERSRAAWAERHTSVIPQYALNYWEANHGSGSR